MWENMLSITGCQFCVAQGNIIGGITILPVFAWGSVENVCATFFFNIISSM